MTLSQIEAVKELHKPDDDWFCCSGCGFEESWPCATAELVYTADEIKKQLTKQAVLAEERRKASALKHEARRKEIEAVAAAKAVFRNALMYGMP